MTLSKRVFDVVLALLLTGLLAPLMMAVAVLILLRDGRPVFYRAERMRAPGQPFALWKFRTMRPAAGAARASGGDQAARITPLGRVLRRRRLDELPQLINILRGDLSFVGPRPPLRRYVARFPDLYAQVLQSRPGVTGLASLLYHRHEEWLLAPCRTAAEVDATYARRCVPAKARLDLTYQRSRSFALDLWVIWRTARVVFGRAV
ncbi:sugar transferase [Actibacterium sp. D379-3]